MVIHDATVVVFGGIVNAQSLLNDIWGYDTAQETWHELESPSNPLLHQSFLSETKFDYYAKAHAYHPPGAPPQPKFKRTPATAGVRPMLWFSPWFSPAQSQGSG